MNDEQVPRPEPLTAAHDLAAFACGEPTLDDWLRRRAVSNQRGVVSRSATAVPPVTTPSRRAPSRSPKRQAGCSITVPIRPPGGTRASRHRPGVWQGRGFGHLLLRDAVLRARQAAEAIGIRGLLVHALSSAAKRFYESRGFRESPANPMTLMVTLSDASAAIGD